MINDWYRLNMELVLTANKISGTELSTYHDDLARQLEQRKTSSMHNHRESGIRKLLKRILRTCY